MKYLGLKYVEPCSNYSLGFDERHMLRLGIQYSSSNVVGLYFHWIVMSTITSLLELS